MGGRKQMKKQTRNRAIEKPSVSSNPSAQARNLKKTDLGAVIFGCTNNTINECLSNQLFGLPEAHYSYIKNISEGFVLFLFNYSDRKLHGIFEAAGPGQKNIVKNAWVANGDKMECTRYPAQVRIRVKKECQPLYEKHFKPIIADNYYDSKHFYFELDHDQTKELIKLFKQLPLHSTASFLQIPTRRNSRNTSLHVTPKRQEYRAIQKSQTPKMTDGLESNVGMEAPPGNPNMTSTVSYASATDEAKCGQTREADLGPKENTSTDKADLLQGNTWEENRLIATTTDEVEHGQIVDSSGQPLDDNQDCQLSSSGETNESDEMGNDEEDDSIVLNTVAETSTDLHSLVNKLLQDVQVLKGSQMRRIVKINMLEDNSDCQLSSSVETNKSDEMGKVEEDDSIVLNTVAETPTDLHSLVNKLLQDVQVFKGSQMRQIVKIAMLEDELAESKQEIQQLRNRIDLLESGSQSIVDLLKNKEG